MRYIFSGALLLTFYLFSLSCVTADSSTSGSSSSVPSWSQAIYCNIEDKQVCAVAQSNDDCKKLGGKKVPACP